MPVNEFQRKGSRKGTDKGSSKGTDKGTKSPPTPTATVALTDSGWPAYVFFGIRRTEDDYVNQVAAVLVDGSETEITSYTDTEAEVMFGPQSLEHFVSLLRLHYMGVDYVRYQRQNNSFTHNNGDLQNGDSD
jgi:hypothetical protein